MSSDNRSNTPSPPATSRRSFLTRSSVVVAGSALASVAVPRVHAAGDDVLKVALVGCGGRGTGAASQILKTQNQGPVKLWAMADVFEDQLERSHELLLKGQEGRYDTEKHTGYGSQIDVAPERRFVGWDAYKRAIDCGVDVVLLTTFPHFRPEQYEYAVKRGVNVFMEKPVAVDAAGIRRILAADEIAKKKDLKVGVGLQRHHNKIYQEAMPRIHGGELGKLHLLRCYWNGSSGSVLMPREPSQTEMEYQMRNKYVFTWLAGDHNVEQHIHNIDVCNWIMKGHPITAQGMGGRQYRNGLEHGEIFDHHAVEYTYADGTKMFSVCRQMPGCWNSQQENVLGEKGTCQLSSNKGSMEIGADKTSWRKTVNPYQVEHDVLVDAIRNDRPHNETHYGALSTMTAIMGRMATYSGKEIEWDKALASEVTLSPNRYAWDGTPPVVPDENGCYPAAMPGVTKVM